MLLFGVSAVKRRLELGASDRWQLLVLHPRRLPDVRQVPIASYAPRAAPGS
jgi:hypothetical protein